MIHSKIVGIIPARFASTRFPGKMLADILGKSLIQRTYENACKASKLDEIVIATDTSSIYNHVISFQGKVVLTSPSCLTGTDRVFEAAKNHFPCAEIVINIQGDEPCLDPCVIDQLVKRLIDDPTAMMVTAAAPISSLEQLQNPSVVKCVFDRNGKALYFSRAPIPYQRHEATIFYRHIGIYAYRFSFLAQLAQLPPTACQQAEDLEQLKVLENGLSIYIEVVKDQNIGIDTPEDLEVIKKQLCENISLSQEALSLL